MGAFFWPIGVIPLTLSGLAELTTKPSPVKDCVVIEWRWVITEQTAGFQSFRMRTFKVRGYCYRHKRINSFMTLKSSVLIVERLRSKAFSPVCLSRYLESQPLILLTTQSPRGEG